MTGRTSLGAAYWSMVFLSVGTVLLLRYAGYQVPIWEWLSEYWPILIIGWGLIKLLDNYRLRGESREVFSAGEVAIVVSVMMAGTALTTAVRIGSDLTFVGLAGEEIDLFDVLGESFVFAETIEARARPGSRIEIRNIYGSVEVEPGTDDAIVVDVTRRIRAIDRAEAERLEPRMRFAIEDTAGLYMIESNRDELGQLRFVGEPLHREVARVNFQDRRGLRSNRRGVVACVGPVRGTDLDEPSTRPAHDIRDSEATTYLDRLTARDDDFSPICDGAQAEQHSRGVVIHGNPCGCTGGVCNHP